MSSINCLVFSPHPDDAELFCGGVLLKLKKQGYSTGIVDLTRGELSTNGDPATRAAEAEEAGEILCLDLRKNLHISDGNIENNISNRKLVIEVIRETRPEICFIPYWKDRHPDHVSASRLIEDAVFYAGLKQLDTGQPAYRPGTNLYYMMHHEFDPSFIVDISEYHEVKTAAIKAYKSQFLSGGDQETYINKPGFLAALEARAAHLGQKIGANYGEGFYYKGKLKIDNIPSFFA